MTGGTLTTATGAIVVASTGGHSIWGPILAGGGIQLNYAVPVFSWIININGGGLGTHDAMTPTFQPTAAIVDLLNLSPLLTPNLKYSVSLSDQAITSALLQAGWPVNVNGGGIGIHDAIAVIRGVIISELLNIGPVLTPAAKYGVTVAQQLKMLDGLFRFVSASMLDGIGMHDGNILNYLGAGIASDVIQIHDAPAPLLIFGMEIDDKIQLTHTQVLKAIYQGDHLLDGVQLRALYVNPNGKYTTWTMNTRTGAVTEYSNYVFNSFAAMGSHYLGARGEGVSSPPGLFILDDARDNGTNIVADIKSGRMAIGGTKFTSFRSAYLGLNVNDTSGESFILKMVAGDGREYIYGVKPNAPGTITKVNMGKGLRSRYFSFELTSDGADFDLDTIEFIPIVSSRRV